MVMPGVEGGGGGGHSRTWGWDGTCWSFRKGGDPVVLGGTPSKGRVGLLVGPWGLMHLCGRVCGYGIVGYAWGGGGGNVCVGGGGV